MREHNKGWKFLFRVQLFASDLLQVPLVALDQNNGMHEKLLHHLHCGRVDILALLQAPGHLPNLLYQDLGIVEITLFSVSKLQMLFSSIWILLQH